MGRSDCSRPHCFKLSQTGRRALGHFKNYQVGTFRLLLASNHETLKTHLYAGGDRDPHLSSLQAQKRTVPI